MYLFWKSSWCDLAMACVCSSWACSSATLLSRQLLVSSIFHCSSLISLSILATSLSFPLACSSLEALAFCAIFISLSSCFTWLSFDRSWELSSETFIWCSCSLCLESSSNSAEMWFLWHWMSPSTSRSRCSSSLCNCSSLLRSLSTSPWVARLGNHYMYMYMYVQTCMYIHVAGIKFNDIMWYNSITRTCTRINM